MTPKLKITNFVIKRLEKVKGQCSGCLFGIMYKGTIVILGFNVETANGTLKYKQIQNNFPTEVDLCGLVKFGLCSDSEAHLTDIFHDIDITDNPILLNCDVGTVVGLKANIFVHGKLEEISYEIIDEDELFKNFFYARLNCSLEVVCEEKEDSIKTTMQKLRKRLASGLVAFNVKNTEIFLTGGSSGSTISGIDSESTMSDILKNSSENNGGDSTVTKSKKKQQQEKRTEYEIFEVEMLFKKTKESTDEHFNKSSGKMILNQTENTKIVIPMKIDALSMVFTETSAISLYAILVESVCRSLRLIERSLVDQMKFSSGISVPKFYHFQPMEFAHFFTCVYPSNLKDDDPSLLARRKKLHHHFGLPMARPYFRRGNSFVFKNELINKPLVNTHVGLKNQVPDGKQYLVHGKYSYHHYMQDSFDDNGWGCAYRSLQTLCSWFRWQGYSDHKIPTHNEIQKHLVEIGDKQKNFIGSKQWIGSTEVSMCLNAFMNVDSRIMYVHTGAELASKGAELSMHFETMGTPIMIGGGVYAHTILGVDYNNQTGELKFLILDPHYTGTDDLTIIQNKGWCGWKNSDFWNKTAYYNLCMPQRPNIY